MSNFEVLHVRKIKTKAGCIEILKHNRREKKNLDEYVDETKSYLNFYKGVTDKDFDEKFKELTKNLKRKIQKNASLLIEFVFSFSPEFSEGWENNPELKKKIDYYFDLSENFLEKRYGYVILSRTDHFDESTPHSHMPAVPICPTKDGGKKFSSSTFLGGKKGMIDLHDQFHKEVGAKFELERGIRDSRTSHSDLKGYKEWEKSQRVKIENMEEELNKKNKDLNEQQKEINNNKKIIEEQNNQLFRLNGELLKKTADLSNREKEIDEIEKNLNEQVPEIPIPPASVIENKRMNWKNEVQETVNVAFKKIKDALISLKIRYDNLLNKCNTLEIQVVKNKNRAEKAEKALLEMPIEEISEARELRKKNNLDQIDNQKKGSKSHVKK